MINVTGTSVSIEKILRMPGYVHGLRFPSLIVHLSVTMPVTVQQDECSRFSAHLESLLQSLDIDLQEQGVAANENAADYLLDWMFSLSQSANSPVFEKGRLIAGAGTRHVLAVPVFETAFSSTTLAMGWLVDSLDRFIAGESIPDQREQVSDLIEKIKKSVSMGFNPPRFLRAAYEADIPTEVVAGAVIQYGQGARARWMHSSFTDESPVISATLSRNKDMASRVLLSAGLPVAANALCKSAERAVEIANSLGYPVVIKPSDKDGGLAVAAGLMNETEVRAAFASAEKHSENILVEKHISGRDYRLNVFNDELLWAIERIPAGITGDGHSTISQLINQENTDPRRSGRKDSALKLLVLDDDAMTVLEQRGYSPNDIPSEGEFVPLRRNANISSGGTPVAVLEKVHPDNRRLAIRAAQALRLDLAGIDLICDDISVSWKESEAAICEVNAQPQLGGVTCPHVYGQILETMIEGNGRIPIAVVVGPAPGSGLLQEVATCLQVADIKAGFADRSGVTIVDQSIAGQNVSFYAAGQMLMRDRTVQAAIITLDSSSVLKTGLPFDHFDILVMAGNKIEYPRRLPAQQRTSMQRTLFDMLFSACSGKIFSSKKARENLSRMGLSTTAHWIGADHSQEQLSKILAEELITRA